MFLMILKRLFTVKCRWSFLVHFLKRYVLISLLIKITEKNTCNIPLWGIYCHCNQEKINLHECFDLKKERCAYYGRKERMLLS